MSAASNKLGEIRLLRRYQRSLLIGGGILLSVAILLGVCVAIWADVQAYIAEGRVLYVANRALLIQELEMQQRELQRRVAYAEGFWHDIGSRRSMRESQDGRLQSDGTNSQWPLGIVTGQHRPQQYARLLALSEHLARVFPGHANAETDFLTQYFVNPELSFMSVTSSSSAGKLLKGISANDARSLIGRLAPGTAGPDDRNFPSSSQLLRRVRWQTLMSDPLTGNAMLQAVAVAYEDAHPFAIFVSAMGVDTLKRWLQKSRYGGTFLIIDQLGNPVLRTWDHQVLDTELTQRVLDSGIWRENLDASTYVYRDGMFTFSEPLGQTGWVFAYTHSWKTILNGRGKFVVTYLVATMLLLALVWIWIVFYLKKILNPLLERSQYIFDNEQLNRTIIATVPNGLCLISLDTGQLLLQNSAMSIYDCNSEPIYLRLLQLRLQQCAPTRLPDADASSDIVHELTVRTRDRQSRFLLVTLVDTRYFGENLLLCSLLDITDRKQSERNLQEARAAAEAASQAKSSFLAAMSHEIRTPLSGILGNLELLSYTSLSALQQDRLQTITHSSRGLLEIMNDVLDMSKIESGHMQVEQIPFDMVDMVEQTLSIFLTLAEEKGLAIYYRISPQLPRCLIGDPTRWRQIVMNLLSNAIKFTTRGWITLSLDIENKADAENPELVLRVVDTGIGISNARQKQLFQPFEQGDASVARQFGGSGLGLSLCQSLAALMNGTITLASEPGKGTAFSVAIPVKIAAMTPILFDEMPRCEIGVFCEVEAWYQHVVEHLHAWGLTVKRVEDLDEWHDKDAPLLLYGAKHRYCGEKERTFQSASTTMIIDAHLNGPRQPVVRNGRIFISCYSLDGLRRSLLGVLTGDEHSLAPTGAELPKTYGAIPPAQDVAVRVLVVEDHLVSRELIGEQLALLGYAARLASNVGEALQLCVGEQFDIVITDLSMPGTDGFMFARMLREQRCRLPIVAMTANASPDEVVKCRDAGIDDVMLKPMSLREIDRVVRRHLLAARSLPPGKFVEHTTSPLTASMLQALRTSSLESLQQIRRACRERHCALMLEKLHAIKGAFAMQKKVHVVDACQAMEVACKDRIPLDFDDKFEKLQDLVLRTIAEIEQARF